MITTQVECPPGTPTTSRQFARSSQLTVKGHIASWGIAGEPGQVVRLEVSGPGIAVFQETTTGLIPFITLGDFEFESFTLPNADVQLTIKITTVFSFSSTQEVELIPIGVGNAVPLPLPDKEQGSSLWSDVLGVLVLVGVGVLIYFLIVHFIKSKGTAL